MKRETTRHKKIPPDLLTQYLAREITSAELGKLTGYHPVYLRRTIKRGERTRKPDDKNKALQLARDNMRKSVAHLPTKEIVELANVSVSTALRIRKKYTS